MSGTVARSFLLAVSLGLAVSVGFGAESAPLSSPASFEPALASIEALISRREWADAAAAAETLLHRVFSNAADGPEAAPLLSKLFALWSLAERERGNGVDARWLWSAALNLDRSVAKNPIASRLPFSGDVSLAPEQKAKRDPSPEEIAALAARGGGSVRRPRPQRLDTPPPDCPASARDRQWQLHVVTEVGIDGRLHNPRIDAGESDAGSLLAAAALESLRHWRPRRRAGGHARGDADRCVRRLPAQGAAELTMRRDDEYDPRFERERSVTMVRRRDVMGALVRCLLILLIVVCSAPPVLALQRMGCSVCTGMNCINVAGDGSDSCADGYFYGFEWCYDGSGYCVFVWG
jgi:hypothetical protein